MYVRIPRQHKNTCTRDTDTDTHTRNTEVRHKCICTRQKYEYVKSLDTARYIIHIHTFIHSRIHAYTLFLCTNKISKSVREYIYIYIAARLSILQCAR